MKRSSTMLMTITALLLTICFFACQKNPVNSNDSNKNVKTATISEDCILPFIDSLDKQVIYQIKDSCAIKYMDDYQNYINRLNDKLSTSPDFENSTTKLVYGAEVDINELTRILAMANSRERETNKLYLMMGVMQSDSTEIIFSLRTTSKMNSDTLWRYFDFTRPCPTSCP